MWMLITTFCRRAHAPVHRFSHIHKYLCWRASSRRPDKLGTSVMYGSQKVLPVPASLYKDTMSQFVSLENPVTGTVWVAW